MIDNYHSLRENFFHIIDELDILFTNGKSLPKKFCHSFDKWKQTIDIIKQQVSEEIIRVAVVGPIKSGKSTFVNSILNGDYLKRGAGVVTSMVTRIHGSNKLKADLVFKSVEEVNSDIDQAMVLFPSLNQSLESKKFNITDDQDRLNLNEMLKTLNSEQLITDDSRNLSSVLLSSYLNGYEDVKDIISGKDLINIFENGKFDTHRKFAGDENLAVYLKDVKLEIPSQILGEEIELADCQGSDSPNPLHIAMIQDYLLITHYIIYVISSRTGIRQADIKFLNMIKKMGIIENILFVVNIDFNEHDSIDNTKSLIEKIKYEISLIKPNPNIYSFSSLYNLFCSQDIKLSSKDKERLGQWIKEEDFISFSNYETDRFKSDFENKLKKERYSILLKNHIERLNLIINGIYNWININQNFLTRDKSSAIDIVNKMNQQQNRIDQIKSMIKNTLEGTIQKMKKEHKIKVDNFFDVRYGEFFAGIQNFIKTYNISYDKYLDKFNKIEFSKIIFMVFQEFKQAVDDYLTESINPRIIRFILEEEQNIKESLNLVSGSYQAMIQNAVNEYNNAILSKPDLDKGGYHYQNQNVNLIEIQTIKESFELTLPKATSIMRYSAKIKTDAVMRFGFHRLINFFKYRILKKKITNKTINEPAVLKGSIKRMKKETEKSIIFHFKDYKENIKFQYILKLIDTASSYLNKTLINQFEGYIADISNINELINKNTFEKENIAKIFEKMKQDVDILNNDIKKINDKLIYLS